MQAGVTCTFTHPSARVRGGLRPRPGRTGKRGRPALKGAHLGTPKDLAATATLTSFAVTRYRRTATVRLADITYLRYDPSRTRTA
ncbi:hypothetical protein [Kitasatospora sp. NPDC056531]|uniref:hypothetical protein n=1 Tax=Kitasatospora sp. NPDC056531 TaxID=3345856 RepID=UPI0036B75855